MRTLLTIILALVASVGLAQSKKDSIRLNSQFIFSKPMPQSIYMMGLKVWFKSNNKNYFPANPDTIFIHVNKSQLRWLNDSTAVIYKLIK